MLNKATPSYSVVVAMSGGVDSSVAAAICVERGWNVIGVTLRLKHPDVNFAQAQSCSSLSDEKVVVKICEKLGIEHHFIDSYPDFEQQVLLPAWKDYSNGFTPNPCTVCNQFIKFGKLLEFAKKVNANAVVTGHYAKICKEDGIFRLQRGHDPNKDQTYFLYRLHQAHLAKIIFPIGDIKKQTVREIAQKFGLINSEKKDSQDACFSVKGEPFAETLRRLFDGEFHKGLFKYKDKVVGSHSGIHRFTIGQRKGLGVALGKPAYIQKIDAAKNEVTITTNSEELLTQKFTVKDINWQSGSTPAFPFKCLVQVRYRSQATPAIIDLAANNDGLIVCLEEPCRAVSPGQAAVFYDANFLLGGGIIERNIN